MAVSNAKRQARSQAIKLMEESAALIIKARQKRDEAGRLRAQGSAARHKHEALTKQLPQLLIDADSKREEARKVDNQADDLFHKAHNLRVQAENIILKQAGG